MRELDEELQGLGYRYSITTANDQHRSSAGGPDDLMGQPISSLQRAIRNTIIIGVKSAVSRSSENNSSEPKSSEQP